MFKKKRVKRVFSIIGIVLVSVILAGVTARLTDNFTDFSIRKLNEDNLLFESYEDFEDYESKDNDITIKNNNGVLRINGKIDDDASDIVLQYATLELEPGEYTYTCFDDPSIDTYYSYISYTDSDKVTHLVIGDIEADDKDAEEFASVSAFSTFTLEEKTTVKFIILVKADQSLFNVKAMPVLVEGDDPGDFYE